MLERRTSEQPDWNGPRGFGGPSDPANGTLGYDAARGQVVRFGGFDTAPLADTWLFDGQARSPHVPATSPPARYAAMMVYDSGRDLLVLFGGQDSAVADSYRNDTWEFDGTGWTEVVATTPPPARRGSLAFDAARGSARAFRRLCGAYHLR